MAATTLLGADDQPAELVGYGPIPAEIARQIAHRRNATRRRLLTDPSSGVLLDYGRTVYRPPPQLDRHVRARARTCVFPGCRQPAVRCDLDHQMPFPHGPNSADNLGPLCRHHHRAKTVAGWTWRRRPDGVVTWTAPTGHTYEVPTPPALD
ncbi:MAG TPA: HNH endonuclease signature motif containing protein [Jiangellaceae bacterium]|nr:HNH endonuclease signature motif containing protein [Jiangellaceae bacterium]